MITFTEKAKDKVHFYLADKSLRDWGVRIRVKPGSGKGPNKYDFSLEELKAVPPSDQILDVSDLRVVLDKQSAIQLLDAKVDFVETPFSSGFKVEQKQTIPVAPSVSGRDLSNDPLAKRIQDVLNRDINPSIASHGGVATLVDLQGKTVYLQMGGGCQGCGMAAATLRQGIEVKLKELIPEIEEVVDATNHAAGANPYYSP